MLLNVGSLPEVHKDDIGIVAQPIEDDPCSVRRHIEVLILETAFEIGDTAAGPSLTLQYKVICVWYRVGRWLCSVSWFGSGLAPR